MKSFAPAFLLLLITATGYTQEATPPDSLMVLKNHVKAVRIFVIAQDGKRYSHKIMFYDSLARVIREQQQENSYYYEYAYDHNGQMVKATQRTAQGKFIQMFTYAYHSADSSRTTIIYSSGDSLTASRSYTQDKNNRITRDVFYLKGQVSSLTMRKYDTKGEVIAYYDSSSIERAANWSSNGLRTSRKTYDPAGKILHSYRFFYNENGRIIRFTDSTGVMKTVEYTFTYSGGQLTGYWRDKTVMDAGEISNLRKEFWYIFPHGDEEEAAYGLPMPEVADEHNLSYDANGNIIRDDIKRTSGSFFETRTFVYEYEFY